MGSGSGAGALSANNKVSGTRGFSMLEMLIAVGILGTALLVILRAQAVNLRMLEYSGNKTAAIMLAEDLISAVSGETPVEPGEKSGRFEGEFSGFRWRTVISPVSYEGAVLEGVYQLDVRVSWGEDDGAVSLSTILRGGR